MSSAGAATIGLVNNAPPRARASVERQFRSILDLARPEAAGMLRLPAIVPSGSYPAETLAAIEASGAGALIVTGAEPTAARLDAEPVWPHIARIADWAASSGVPVFWSCLAAHACVLHLDGIERQPLPRKLSGLYDCAVTRSDDPLCAGLPARIRVPHSRLNDLDESRLEAAGYQILSRTGGHGVDLFARTTRSGARFLFAQGHPEYFADTLGAEYVRDLRRYLLGERTQHPSIPAHCFDENTVAALTSLEEGATRPGQAERRPALLDGALRVLATAACHDGWRRDSARLFRNWLDTVSPLNLRTERELVA